MREITALAGGPGEPPPVGRRKSRLQKTKGTRTIESPAIPRASYKNTSMGKKIRALLIVEVTDDFCLVDFNKPRKSDLDSTAPRQSVLQVFLPIG